MENVYFCHKITHENVQKQKNLQLQLEKLLPITSDQFPTKATRPAYAVLAMKKIQAVFGIMPCDWRRDLIATAHRLKA